MTWRFPARTGLYACVRYWPYRGVGKCASVLNLVILRCILKFFFPRTWELRPVHERIIRSIKYDEGKLNVVKSSKVSFSGLLVFPSGLSHQKDIINSRQNLSKNKNCFVKTPWHEIWKLLALGYWLLFKPRLLCHYSVNKVNPLWEAHTRVTVTTHYFRTGTRRM